MKRRQQTKNIVSFSGGKDSTAMLLMMIEKGIKIDHIVFVDTTCFCCPLSKIEELGYIYNCRPELWKEIKMMDKKSYRDFRPDYTLEELEERVKND